jgi:melibiose permease/lactose/raffinose/galactose permease
MIIQQKKFTGDNVPPLTKWLYGISGMSRDAVETLVSVFYLLYIQYAGVLDENPSQYAAQLIVIIGFLFFARLWDGVNDPIIGSIINRTNWKIGKYKPWILIGGIFSSFALIALFVVRLNGWMFVGFFIITYLIWEFMFTLNDIAYWSLLPSLTTQIKQRNELTSIVTMFAAIGALAIVGFVSLTISGNAAEQYGIIATITAVIFLLFQTALFLFAQEKDRPEILKEKPKGISFRLMYRTWFNNKPLFWLVWVLLLYYMGASIINNFGLTYFYFSVGYDTGGALLPIMALIFAFSTTVAQILYPTLAKRFSRKRLIKISFIFLAIGYSLFYLLGSFGPIELLPINTITILPIGLLIFTGQTIFYVTIMVMLSNTVEYNQWKTGERLESIIYSLRPLTAKLASSIQSGVVYLFLILSGIYTVTNQISALENQKQSELITSTEVINLSNDLIAQFHLENVWGLTIFKTGMVLIPIVLFFLGYWILRNKATIDEPQYEQILKDLENNSLLKDVEQPKSS